MQRLVASLVLAALAPPAAAQPTAAQPAAAPPVLDLAGLGPPQQACTDFFAYVNGAWLARATIPADRARIGSFTDLVDSNNRVLEHALAQALADPTRQDTPGKRLTTTYYASGLDEAAIERAGLVALQPWLKRIDVIAHPRELPATIGEFNRIGVAAPLSIYIAPDPADRRREMVQVMQSGLGLTDRDDYLKDDARSRALQEAYRVYRERLWTLSGMPAEEVARLSPQVYALEARLARASLSRVQLRDPPAIYHPSAVADLPKLAQGLDWTALFTGFGTPQPGTVNLATPDFAQVVAQATTDIPLDVWRAYLRLRLLDAAAPRLPRAYEEAHFAYRERAVRGTQAPRPRNERTIELISGRIGNEPLAEGLGQLYVAAAFSPLAQQRATAMVEDIRAAMRVRIEQLPWMSDATRERALRKLDAMALKIGAPARWKTYDGLLIRIDDYAGNWLHAGEWQHAQRVADLARPVDRSRWFTSPHIVNAFAGGLNEIVFPAGILQPPFFDPRADDAVNYGGIGAVIGHEITHHFDDRGRQFDEVGNLSDWWTPQDAERYRERAARVAAQYDAFEPLPGVRINGKQTLGENISDVGGIQIAYAGLQRALARRDPGPIDGFTPAQRFFVSYGTIWRSKMRDEALLDQLRTGQHSPARYRVLGPLAHKDAFAQAFACPPDAPMLRAEAQRILIW